MPPHALILGSGVVGASSAYYLAKKGWRVTLIDRAAFGRGSSHANCGYVCPSHVFPLCKPGAIASTLPLILRKNSPFCIRPRLDFSLFSFFTQFARNCREDLATETSYALHDLLQSGKRCYEEIIAAEKIDCEYTALGCLFVYLNHHHFDAFAATNDLIRERFGFAAERVTGPQLAAMEPTLRDGLAGAWLFREDAHIRPDRFMSGLRTALERLGVTIREHCEAIALSNTPAPGAVSGAVGRGSGRPTSSSNATTLETTQGPLHADAFVVATGAWTPFLSDSLGIRLPIQPGKGYSLTMPRPQHCPTYPMVFEEHRVAITPFREGYRLGSTMEFAGYDDSIRSQRLQLLRDGARHYLRHPDEVAPPQSHNGDARHTSVVHETPPNEEPWSAWRPMTPDGRPFIDFAPKFRNVLVAAGHNMIGMSTGPGTGRLVAELLTGEPPHFDPKPFRIARESV